MLSCCVRACGRRRLTAPQPSKAKMMAPRYQELKDKDVPRATSPDGKTVVKVIAGEVRAPLLSPPGEPRWCCRAGGCAH